VIGRGVVEFMLRIIGVYLKYSRHLQLRVGRGDALVPARDVARAAAGAEGSARHLRERFAFLLVAVVVLRHAKVWGR
jgi:hypothetical protein